MLIFYTLQQAYASVYWVKENIFIGQCMREAETNVNFQRNWQEDMTAHAGWDSSARRERPWKVTNHAVCQNVYESIVLRTTKRQEGLSSHFSGLISTRLRSLHSKKSSSERRVSGCCRKLDYIKMIYLRVSAKDDR